MILHIFLENIIISILAFWVMWVFTNNVINRKRYVHCRVRNSIFNYTPELIIIGFLFCIGVSFLLKSLGLM